MADTPKIYEALSEVQNELRAPKDAYEAKCWAAQSVKKYGQPLCAHCYMGKRKAEGKA